MIEIRYISTDSICYFCKNCNQEHLLSFEEDDAQKDWFRFECKVCGGEAKRAVNLRRFLGRSEI